MQRIFSNNSPELRIMWEEYELCRQLQYVSMEVADSKKKGATKLVTFLYPTGFSQFPKMGGVLDQPYLYVRVFRAFLLGERSGTMRKIQRTSLPFAPGAGN